MIELCVLGSLELKRQDGSPVSSVLSQPKRAALLCYLALTAPAGFRRRDELLALFWPEQDTEHARAALRQSIYFLRRSLGDEVLCSQGDEEVGVDRRTLNCDALGFEALVAAGQWQAALELYRGDLLPGFLLDGAPEVVEWLERERVRLRGLAAAAAWQVADLRRAGREAAAAAEWGRRALAYAPLDEGAVARCMQLLAESGDRAGALQVFEEYGRRLEHELELEPSAAIRALAAELRSSPAETVPAPVAAAATPVTASSVTPPPARRPAPRSIAVLPFRSMSANADDAYLSDGLTDEIITTLTKIPGLRVASRTSSFAFRGQSGDVREIGRQLNVATVLEGSVQRSGERLRITAQLIECTDGYHLWASKWDSPMGDVFAIEDEIAASVSARLRTILQEIEDAGAPRLPRTNVHAYEHYLRGREYFLRTRRRDMGYAKEMFEKSIEADPQYALAHAALAETIALERMYYPAYEADMPAAERASLRALELDPGLAEAHSARGSVLFQQERWEEAEAAFREALRIDPQHFEACYFFARMCFQTGRLQEAAGLFERACRIREDYPAAYFAAQALEALGRHPEALAHYELAHRCAAEHMDLHPDDPRAATMRAVALCRVGRVQEGLAWGRRATELDPDDAGVAYNVVCLHAVAGETEEAMRLLKDVVRAGFGNRGWLEQDPDLDSIRPDPRFQALVAAM